MNEPPPVRYLHGVGYQYASNFKKMWLRAEISLLHPHTNIKGEKKVTVQIFQEKQTLSL